MSAAIRHGVEAVPDPAHQERPAAGFHGQGLPFRHVRRGADVHERGALRLDGNHGRTPRAGRQLGTRSAFELREDLVLFREAAGLVLREEQDVVLMDVEDAGAPLDELGFRAGLLPDPGRQTGGPRKVVSATAVVDGDGHFSSPGFSRSGECSRIVAPMSDRLEDRCAARIRELYGDDLLTPSGVLHVTSAWSDSGGRLFTLRIGPNSPASATDFFALELARARVDAIVTTGQILRDEPGLTNELTDPELASWRRERLGKKGPPVTVVLSRRTDLPRSHPLFATSEVVVRNAGLRESLAWLCDERGFTSVAIEAGPSTSRAVYDPPVAVDELLLSIYRAPELPEGVRGGELLGLPALGRLFPERSECTREEESGMWSFLRLHS